MPAGPPTSQRTHCSPHRADILSAVAAVALATLDAQANHGNFTLNNLIACAVATGERRGSCGCGCVLRLGAARRAGGPGAACQSGLRPYPAPARPPPVAADLLGLVGLKSFRVAAVLLLGLLAYGAHAAGHGGVAAGAPSTPWPAHPRAALAAAQAIPASPLAPCCHPCTPLALRRRRVLGVWVAVRGGRECDAASGDLG